ncbi:hypothetical protein [Sphingomonas aerolata]|uniref:hypothetical protein n=1 Tax=Sphingomonas aerolata TaxID=185951 RepID=UPI00208F1EAB|nr:hypothetical protein [Sphingomonas aerolata]USR02360.1 hypothetical protein NEF64_19215 [Sphingomonas aerolata]
MTTTAARVDLAAALPALQAHGGYPSLAEAVRIALNTASAHEDLRGARDALLLLRRLTKEIGIGADFSEGEHNIMVGTLFSQAIVLYARATDTPPIKGEREPWFGSSKLPPASRPVHAQAMALRNKAIAHFGKAEALPEGALLREALVMRPIDGGAHLAFLASRLQNRAHFAVDLLALTEIVQDLAFEAVQSRYAEIGAQIFAAAKARDGVLIGILRAYLFDGTHFFPGEDWQAQMNAMEDDPRPVLYASVLKPDRKPESRSELG